MEILYWHNRDGFNIICTGGSYAQEYATANEIPCTILDKNGDITADNKLTASDAAMILQKTLDNSFMTCLLYTSRCV